MTILDRSGYNVDELGIRLMKTKLRYRMCKAYIHKWHGSNDVHVDINKPAKYEIISLVTQSRGYTVSWLQCLVVTQSL